MTRPRAPLIDRRDAAAVFAALLHRRPAYVPGWKPGDSGAGRALLQIAARYVEVLNERLNQAPEKNLLAFLDLLGESLVEAQAARAPLVFAFTPPAQPLLPASHSPTLAALNLPPPAPVVLPPISVRVPAGTQVAAAAPAGGQLVFETEQAIGLTGATLAQVVSLWPGRDTYEDHSAAVATEKPFTTFRSVTPTPHILYLAHETDLVLKGKATVEISFDLVVPGSSPLSFEWEYWDGQGWHPFGDPNLAQPGQPQTVAAVGSPPVAPPAGAAVDGTAGLTRGGMVRLSGECVDVEPVAVNGIAAHWLRGRLEGPLLPDLARQDALVQRIRINSVVERFFAPGGLNAPGDFKVLRAIFGLNPQSTVKPDPAAGVSPDLAFADSTAIDLSKAFYPLGASPLVGSTFYLSSEEVFSRSNAVVRLALVTVPGPQGPAAGSSDLQVVWEYFDGTYWQELAPEPVYGPGSAPNFINDGVFGFTVPAGGIPISTHAGKQGRWLRARIATGGYYVGKSIAIAGSSPITIIEAHPPLLADLRLAYVYRSPRTFPDHCLAYNDFIYSDHTADLRWPTAGFSAFHAVTDATPALYLGFDQAPPVDLVSMYASIEEQDGQESGPPLTWEYWDGLAWRELAVQDDTARLVRPGVIAFVGPADGIALARFGSPRFWLRGRLREDGPPLPAVFDAIYLNATWATQAQTVRNEVLGSASGEAKETFFFSRRPVLDGEVVEVRELDGPRAAVELPILARYMSPSDLNVLYDVNGVVREVWVRWHRRQNLYLSGPNDRHYVLERSRGRLMTGDGTFGRLLTAGLDNVIARLYRTAGGAASNVSAGTITQLLAGLPYVSRVTNPRAAEGGADGETPDQIRVRGPQVLRHRERALAARDYESLAHEASPGVAVARALPATNPAGRPARGWVTLILLPQSQDPRPVPSFELRRQVHDYVLAHAPAGLAGLYVTAPAYLEVGATVTVSALDPGQAGPVGVSVRTTIERFFHPLYGGPDGNGWPFGRAVYLSDLAGALAGLPGVNYVQELELLVGEIAQGDVVPVPPNRIVVAGSVQVRVRADQRSTL